MEVHFPKGGLAILVGAPGSGKTALAARLVATCQVLSTEIVSSDLLRAQICDDLGNQSVAVTAATFDLLHRVVDFRLKHRKRVLVDATNVEGHTRPELLKIARQYSCPTVAIVLNTPAAVCQERNAVRVGPKKVEQAYMDMLCRLMRTVPRKLAAEHFDQVVVVSGQRETEKLVITNRDLAPKDLQTSWLESAEEHLSLVG